MAQDFSPTEIFKRATAATLRAIAERSFHIGLGFNLRYCKDAIKSGNSGDLPLVLSKGSF